VRRKTLITVLIVAAVLIAGAMALRPADGDFMTSLRQAIHGR
jgi:hypothetical protein